MVGYTFWHWFPPCIPWLCSPLCLSPSYSYTGISAHVPWAADSTCPFVAQCHLSSTLISLAAFCSNPGAGCELLCLMKSHSLPCSMGMALGEAAICSMSLARWQDGTVLLEVAF